MDFIACADVLASSARTSIRSGCGLGGRIPCVANAIWWAKVEPAKICHVGTRIRKRVSARGFLRRSGEMKVAWLWPIASLGLAFLCWYVELCAESTDLFRFGHSPSR
jgi:hypothetical protein